MSAASNFNTCACSWCYRIVYLVRMWDWKRRLPVYFGDGKWFPPEAERRLVWNVITLGIPVSWMVHGKTWPVPEREADETQGALL